MGAGASVGRAEGEGAAEGGPGGEDGNGGSREGVDAAAQETNRKDSTTSSPARQRELLLPTSHLLLFRVFAGVCRLLPPPAHCVRCAPGVYRLGTGPRAGSPPVATAPSHRRPHSLPVVPLEDALARVQHTTESECRQATRIRVGAPPRGGGRSAGVAARQVVPSGSSPGPACGIPLTGIPIAGILLGREYCAYPCRYTCAVLWR